MRYTGRVGVQEKADGRANSEMGMQSRLARRDAWPEHHTTVQNGGGHSWNIIAPPTDGKTNFLEFKVSIRFDPPIGKLKSRPEDRSNNHVPISCSRPSTEKQRFISAVMPRHGKSHCTNSLRNKFALAIKQVIYASTAKFRTQVCQIVKIGKYTKQWTMAAHVNLKRTIEVLSIFENHNCTGRTNNT